MMSSLGASKSRWIKPKFQRAWKGYIFLIPVFVLLISFKYIPFMTAVVMSFFEWNAANIRTFIGVQNFVEMMHDKMFWISMKNVGIYTISNLLIQLTVPLISAVLVYHVKNKKLQNFFKVWFIVPLVVPLVVVFLMWKWIYQGDYGVINEFLTLIGLESWTHAWLGESATAIWAIIFVNFPWISGTTGVVSGISFLIYLAGLMSISEELFEVGKIDGLNPIQRFFIIEMPLVKSQIKLVITLTIISQVQAFENILILTDGGPGFATLSPALYLYQQGFTYNKFGYASAVGVVLFVFLMVITFVNQKYLKNTEKAD